MGFIWSAYAPCSTGAADPIANLTATDFIDTKTRGALISFGTIFSRGLIPTSPVPIAS